MPRILFLMLRAWARLELVLASVLLFGVVALIGYQIIARSLFGAPLVWAEEAAMLAFLWIIFLGAGLAAKIGQHIQVTALEGIGGEKFRVFLLYLGAVISTLALIGVLWLAYGLIPVEWRTTSIALPVDLPKAYYYSIPLIYSCISMIVGFFSGAILGSSEAGREALNNLRGAIVFSDHSEGAI